MPGVDAASRFLSIPAAVKGTSSSVALQVTEDAAVSSPLVMSGAAYDENGDGIWLSDRFADENGIRLGDTLTLTYLGLEISGPVVGLIKSGENMICVADENQLMPDFARFGFAYVSPQKLAGVLGTVYYPQLHLLSGLEKTVLEDRLRAATGTTLLVTAKEEHIAYAGMQSEAEEGKTMGAVLPVLFLGIAVLTMVTTMHRIAANEKVQIGTLKALGFRDRRILLHYASYGLAIGLAGSALGVALGCLIASFIIGPVRDDEHLSGPARVEAGHAGLLHPRRTRLAGLSHADQLPVRQTNAQGHGCGRASSVHAEGRPQKRRRKSSALEPAVFRHALEHPRHTAA